MPQRSYVLQMAFAALFNSKKRVLSFIQHLTHFLTQFYNAYKYYIQPTRCKNNSLLIIPVSSICFGQLFCPSSGTLDCVLQLVV